MKASNEGDIITVSGTSKEWIDIVKEIQWMVEDTQAVNPGIDKMLNKLRKLKV